MLYLLNKDVRTVRWNGEPLHEATSAIVKETMNGDFTLTVKYPISDSGIYQLIQEDMLINAPTPVLGKQLFRIKKPVEHNDHLEITAYHISDDVMQRSITPMSVNSQSCGMALSRMVQNTKTALGDFSFNSDIQDRRTFNTTETETLYSVLLDGKHSIVGTWDGELVRDNFALTVKRSRGENRGVVITTHKNLKDYQRTKNSQNVVTRIHAKSTFKPEGAEKETTIRVTVDSPLINSYPYINEKEYENNNAKTVEELQKWAQAKFSNEGIDKISDAVKIEAYELDGQVVHMGDTVNLKSWKHNVDAFKKAIAYEFDALKEEYISLTFDDKAGTGGSRASGGLSSAANAILGVTESAQEIALEKALQNADLDFDHQAGLLRQEILDGIELARAKAEEVKRDLSDTINQRFDAGDLISGINLGANGHNRFVGKLTHITGETLIDKAVIKSAMVDKLKTANFEAGSVTTTILDAEAVTADKVRMDQAFANKLVASNIFTDTLAAKEAFINKLRSVVVTATLLEGYKGRIGGFQIGTHEKDSSVYWITGQNQFSVGMSNGSGKWNQTALWVNWGNDWTKPSDTAWFVKNNGRMFCYNRAEFWNTPIIHGDLKVTGHIFYNNENSGKSGHWIHSSKYSNFEPSNNYLYLYYSGSGYDWIPMNKEISDRRYKHNIEDSTVSGLDVIQKLKTYSYRKEYDGKIEDIACGIMAQDVQKYAPEAFFENPDGAYSYRTFELVPYLIKAIQELNQKLEEIA